MSPLRSLPAIAAGLSTVALLAACGPKAPAVPAGVGAYPLISAQAEAPAPDAQRPAPPDRAGTIASGIEQDAAQADAPSAADPAPSASQAALHTALSARDGAPECASLEELSQTLVADLLWIIDHVAMPPTAGVRAADCLAERHAAEIPEVMERWVTDPRLKGFGFVVLSHLDDIPLEQALKLATLALTGGPDPDAARRRILRAKTPEIRALAEPGGPEPR